MARLIEENQSTMSDAEIEAQIDRELASLDDRKVIPPNMRFYFEEIVKARLTGQTRSVENKLKLANQRIVELVKDEQKQLTLLSAASNIARANRKPSSEFRL